MNDTDRRAIVAEIADLIRPPRLEPGVEVTAAMVAEQEGILPRTAAYQLEKAWRAKQLQKRRVHVGSHRPWAYRIVTSVTDSVTDGASSKECRDTPSAMCSP